MKISQSSVDIHKNALYAIAVNSIQIVAAVVLAALLVIEKNNLAIDIFSIVIAVVVTAGAALDIREAMAARRKSDELFPPLMKPLWLREAIQRSRWSEDEHAQSGDSPCCDGCSS